MPKMTCPDCDRDVALHELQTKTVARRQGFDTRYRCPFCRSDVDNVFERLN